MSWEAPSGEISRSFCVEHCPVRGLVLVDAEPRAACTGLDGGGGHEAQLAHLAPLPGEGHHGIDGAGLAGSSGGLLLRLLLRAAH